MYFAGFTCLIWEGALPSFQLADFTEEISFVDPFGFNLAPQRLIKHLSCSLQTLPRLCLFNGNDLSPSHSPPKCSCFPVFFPDIMQIDATRTLLRLSWQDGEGIYESYMGRSRWKETHEGRRGNRGGGASQ